MKALRQMSLGNLLLETKITAGGGNLSSGDSTRDKDYPY